MTNCGKNILINREGTAQSHRDISSLDPDNLKLNDFGLKEWMKFAYQFGKHINYFATTNYEIPSGDWSDFFINDSDLDTFLNSLDEGQNISPHLALYIAFVYLLEYSKSRFNKLTKKHLDFYYKNILQIENKVASPDKVHVIFDLAKNCVEEKITAGTALVAGKDENGKKLIYKTRDELIANKGTVGSLMSIYCDNLNSKFKAASVANSYDGIGGDFPDDDIKWWPFGYSSDSDYSVLPDAEIGFALAGDIFELSEGVRNIQLSIGFDKVSATVSGAELSQYFNVYCSGEDGWMGPYELQTSIKNNQGHVIFNTGLEKIGKKMKLAFQIPIEDGAVTSCDAESLGENYNTDSPVCKLVLKTDNTSAFQFYQKMFGCEINSLLVNVDVQSVTSLILSNDTGSINPKKPFYPFGVNPVKGSNFNIGNNEVFKKNWSSIDLDILWKNTPEQLDDSMMDAFKSHYFAYRTDYLNPSVSSVFKTASSSSSKISQSGSASPTNLIVTGDNYFKASVKVFSNEDWKTDADNQELFINDGDQFGLNFTVTNSNYKTDSKSGIRLSLNQSFLHELFPRIYALSFSSDDAEKLVPNQPYSPLIECVSLNYKAESAMSLTASSAGYAENNLSLFQKHPFGNSEVHPWLKNQLGFLGEEEKKIHLFPTYCEGGELYIGLEDIEALQQVSLLVQLLEGSEDPEAESFDDDEKVSWYALVQDEWLNLDSGYMVTNETDNFLKTGIVSFTLPNSVSTSNYLLPEGKIWIKAQMNKVYNTVCKVIDIKAQAVLAEFSDNGNELSHLENGIEAGTITKPEQRQSFVKSVTQPYSSFDGVPEESDANYYRRVSERLRHKQRAVNLWDYEHLIAQKFSQIYKVKCLNHTSANSFLSPGNVTVIVIPDIRNTNVFDIYQPRVSKSLLNEVQEYINKLNSMHVEAQVINPVYEEVKVSLKVQFYKGYNESYYTGVLNDDIVKLLSPWAFEASSEIKFGTKLYKGQLINYIEKLEYVDYVEDVELSIKKQSDQDFNEVKVAEASCPKAILVSSKEHEISTAITTCKTVSGTNKIVKTCQK